QTSSIGRFLFFFKGRFWPKAASKSPDRHNLFLIALGDSGYRKAPSSCLLNMLTPPFHHRTAALNVVSTVIGAPNLILIYVSQGHLNQLWLEALFVQGGAGNGAHAVTDQAASKPHAF